MLCLFLTILCIKGSVAENGPLVNTSLGQIRGFYTTSFEGRTFSAFEGIPYAKPPIGDLRFEPPQNVPPWNGVLNANKQYVCKQVDHPFLGLGKSTEDCLYLNVYVPKMQISTDDNYDVIVNIHGGAFMMGASRAFAGPRLLMDRDIIYVNMNYRLGILGKVTYLKSRPDYD
uniref:Carboxylesterase type B domain-containing protein n=1 Tax=Photinus pyralis TaxID=7054 RepID=A0A1Y1LR71_PHOPY